MEYPIDESPIVSVAVEDEENLKKEEKEISITIEQPPHWDLPPEKDV